MDDGQDQSNGPPREGREQFGAACSSVGRLVQRGSDVLLLTDLDGTIRRLSFTSRRLTREQQEACAGESLLQLFATDEHALLAGILKKAHDAPSLEICNLRIVLLSDPRKASYLSVVRVAGSFQDPPTLSWRLSQDDHTQATALGNTERILQRRIAMLNRRAAAHLESSEHTRRAFASSMDTNRALTRSLQAARTFRDRQTAVLLESIAAKNQLIESERELWAEAVKARRTAEQAQQRMDFLAEASRTLAQSLDFDTTLRHVAELVVPRVADCCIVHLLDQDLDVLRRTRVACKDASIADRIESYPEQHIGQNEESHPLYRAIRADKSVVIHDVTKAEFSPSAGGPDVRAQFREIGITSCIVTVLRSRERVFGTVTFASTKAERRMLPEDLPMFEEFTFRASQALDNALLYQSAEDAFKARERYLSMASHELRSPLTVVSGFGALILRQLATDEPDLERIQMLGHELQRGVERLELLTDGLLASASLNEASKDGSFTQLNLSTLVEEVLTGVNSAPDLIGQHTVTYDAPESIVGYWDAESLERALFNLVSNALKYSPDTSNVHVSIGSDDQVAWICVCDEGIGISEEDQKELFGAFVRGRAARETAQGTGLGLYITRQIVEQHGGEIEVESEMNVGSTFTIRLPLKSPDR